MVPAWSPYHDVVVVAVERRWFRVEVVFGPVGWRTGVGVVGGVTEPPAGGPSHGLPKVIRPVAPGAGALAGALGDVTRRPYGWYAAREPHPERRAAHELRVELVHLRGIVGVGLVEETDVEELDAELHAVEALRLVVGREGDAAFRPPCVVLGRSVDVAHRDASVDIGLVRQVHVAVNAAVGCLRHRSRLKVEEQAGGGLEAADAAGLARNRGVRYLRQRREACKEGCVGDLARVRRHPSEEVSEQGMLGRWDAVEPFGWAAQGGCSCVHFHLREDPGDRDGGEVVVRADVVMRVEHARRRLSALPALKRAAVCRARAERAKAEVMPERSGVLVGLGGGQERRVCVVGAAGYVAHCVVY